MRRSPLVGTDVARIADIPLLTGTGRYIADLDVEGQAYARVVRSPVAHARILAVEVAEALAMPGVVAVLTADDLPDVRIPIRLPMAETPEALKALQPPLARDKVRYVGEPVALVIAEDPFIAEDAAEYVELDLDELDCKLDVLGDERGGATRIHDALTSNTVNRIPLLVGDVDAAFSEADIVVRRQLRMHRHSAVPMETRGLLAEPNAIGDLTLWGGAKVKHFTKRALAEMLSIDPARVRVAEVNVGGGFGVRGEPYPEDFLVAFAALHLKRPIKWIEDRAEHFVATNHGRDQVHDFEIAARGDGTLLAFRDRGWCDQGAYVRSQGTLPSLLPAVHLAGPYAWRAFELETAGIVTNRTPVGTYRGPGMTEATFVRESMIDAVAAAAGLGAGEMRLRNLIPADSIPHTFAVRAGSAPAPPLTYESGDFPGSLNRLLEEAGYADLVRRRDEARRRGELWGVGLAVFTEIGGIGPYEEATVSVREDGTVVIGVGVGSLGQGVETALAQIAADRFGVNWQAVHINHHSTDAVAMGFGSFASRSTLLAGNAIADAARVFACRAASMLEEPVDVVELRDGAAHGRNASVHLSTFGSVVGRFDKPHPSFSFGGALSLVSVDRSTGAVTVLEHHVMHDVGRAVNPALLRGQLVGAAAQGIAGALYEEFTYDANGQPQATSFLDYHMPTCAEIPEIKTVVIENPTTANPLGIKGGGESGIVGTPAAIANAVADALSEFGATVTRLPLTPDRVWSLIRECEAKSAEPISAHSTE
ncbi:xanthine dehydrogenase family protein molybdopterin-binding subunit [Mycolicibacterium sp.]|uniref:xanthine dehydrogenase family protein molybdopterin-binding subunit n=1 Tax=Mycolicibacterium sp. TaxID=2320850 RepID=UPI0037CC386D